MSVAFFVIDPRQMQTTTIFDGADRPIEVMDAERNVTTTAYDDAGRWSWIRQLGAATKPNAVLPSLTLVILKENVSGSLSLLSSKHLRVPMAGLMERLNRTVFTEDRKGRKE